MFPFSRATETREFIEQLAKMKWLKNERVTKIGKRKGDASAPSQPAPHFHHRHQRHQRAVQRAVQVERLVPISSREDPRPGGAVKWGRVGVKERQTIPIRRGEGVDKLDVQRASVCVTSALPFSIPEGHRKLAGVTPPEKNRKKCAHPGGVPDETHSRALPGRTLVYSQCLRGCYPRLKSVNPPGSSLCDERPGDSILDGADDRVDLF